MTVKLLFDIQHKVKVRQKQPQNNKNVGWTTKLHFAPQLELSRASSFHQKSSETLETFAHVTFHIIIVWYALECKLNVQNLIELFYASSVVQKLHNAILSCITIIAICIDAVHSSWTAQHNTRTHARTDYTWIGLDWQYFESYRLQHSYTSFKSQMTAIYTSISNWKIAISAVHAMAFTFHLFHSVIYLIIQTFW